MKLLLVKGLQLANGNRLDLSIHDTESNLRGVMNWVSDFVTITSIRIK